MFLTVISSAFVRTTSPVLPKTDVIRLVPPDPAPPAKPICLICISTPVAGALVNDNTFESVATLYALVVPESDGY